MAFLPQPTKPGTYRIKVFDTDNDHYWKFVPDRDLWVQLATVDRSNKPSSTQFKWDIFPVAGAPNTFTIHPAFDTDLGLVSSADGGPGRRYVQGKPGASARWNIELAADGQYSKIKIDNTPDVLDSRDTETHRVHFYQLADVWNQRFVFEFVHPAPPTFEQLWFQLTPEKASEETYDMIIVGTGMGGGVIAGDVYDTNSRLGKRAKSVLVIEKGGLNFHSHCLNASRPSGFGEDRGQQNDTFFSLFKENYRFRSEAQSKEWKGGPMFNVGGRSAAWGLFIPRIHDDNLRDELGPELFSQLVRDHSWYKMAEDLMNLYLPQTNSIHLDLMERLNIKTTERRCQWQWGRIASEFDETKNFDIPSGAYSPIDKLLEIAMSKKRNPDGKVVEHPNWKILINTEVREIIWDTEGSRAAGVIVRNSNGKLTNIFLKRDGGGNLINVAVDASSFLPRTLDHAQSFTTQDFPKLIVAHILPAPLDEDNTIDLDSNGDPVVNAQRRPPFSNSNPDVAELRELTKVIIEVIQNRLGIELRSTDEPRDDDYFKALELGGVAHELGTIPLKSYSSSPDHPFFLDQNLDLRGKKGVYVCDLSVFPYSPEVNPTLTLVALALRLSRFIHSRAPALAWDADTVYVMNQTGENIKVFISNRARVELTPEEIADNVTGKILEPGDILARKRARTVGETVMVYRLDFNSTDSYQPRPELRLATPGNLRLVD